MGKYVDRIFLPKDHSQQKRKEDTSTLLLDLFPAHVLSCQISPQALAPFVSMNIETDPARHGKGKIVGAIK